MNIVTKVKGGLLRTGYVKKLNSRLKIKKFYGKGIKSNGNSETILFWSTGGMPVQSNLEGVIASALKLRGHRVRMILCDGVYTACAKRVDHPEAGIKDWGKYCPYCIRQNTGIFAKLGVEYSYISNLVSGQRQKELRDIADKVTFENHKELSLDGIHLGPHLESAMLRHTRGGSYADFEDILREYAFTVLINAEASKEAIKKWNPSRIYMSHGIYADWGPALSVFLSSKIPVTSYISCYLAAHFFFGTVRNFDEVFLAVSNGSWKSYKAKTLTEIQKTRLEDFLGKRYLSDNAQDLRGLLKEYKGNREFFFNKYGLDAGKPVWGIMTHINWDAVSDYFPMIHSNFDEWLYETVKEIYEIKDVQWLIKIHPSEINDNPLTGCQKYIEKNFPDLPPHIKVIKMDDDISPLDFYSLLDGAVTVMGTGGLELSLKGKPVILAGEAHYSRKGFTLDAKDRDNYRNLLREVKNFQPLDAEKLSLAWKYAYIYFILKQIPLMPAVKEDLSIDYDMLYCLYAGNNKFMDFLCDRIIDGKDFILPEGLIDAEYITGHEQIRNFA